MRSRPAFSRRASVSLRIMRCGRPSILVVTQDVIGAGARVALLGGLRHRAVAGHEEARAHGDTLRTVGKRGCQAAAVGETAGGDHGHLDRVQHLRQQHRAGHRTGMTATLAALHDEHVDAELHHFLRMLDRTDGGDAGDAGLTETRDHLAVRPAPEAHRGDLALDEDLDDARGARLEHVEVHPERRIRERAHRDRSRDRLPPGS